MFKAYLQLMRIPNTFTAATDVMAGYLFVSGPEIQWDQLVFLALASMSLYGGGVTLNDYFDYYKDLKERPERPLPAQKISRAMALLFGLALILIGNALAWTVSWHSFFVSLAITLCIFLYDALLKEIPVLGPSAMAGCRFFNLLLGSSVLPHFHYWRYLVAFLLFAYVFALTLLSKGEDGKLSKSFVFSQLYVMIGIILALLLLHIFQVIPRGDMLVFLAIFSLVVLFTVINLAIKPGTPEARGAIRNLVLGIILFDAVIVSGSSSYVCGIFVVSMIIPAWILSRYISVS